MTDPFPYAPQGADTIGKAPVAGADGERGTSAFTGNDDVDADGFATSETPATGPSKGTWYYTAQNPTPVGTGIQTPTRETADTNPVSP